MFDILIMLIFFLMLCKPECAEQSYGWETMNLRQCNCKKKAQITKFTRPTWGSPGPCRPQVAPCWPRGPCYQGVYLVYPLLSNNSSNNSVQCASTSSHSIKPYRRWQPFHVIGLASGMMQVMYRLVIDKCYSWNTTGYRAVIGLF